MLNRNVSILLIFAIKMCGLSKKDHKIFLFSKYFLIKDFLISLGWWWGWYFRNHAALSLGCEARVRDEVRRRGWAPTAARTASPTAHTAPSPSTATPLTVTVRTTSVQYCDNWSCTPFHLYRWPDSYPRSLLITFQNILPFHLIITIFVEVQKLDLLLW